MGRRRSPRKVARSTGVVRIGRFARYDVGRAIRTGTPEIVLGEGKTTEHLLEILHGLRARGKGALVSRATPAQRRALSSARTLGLPIRFSAGDRVARLAGPLGDGRPKGTVALVTAGTSDVPTADEAEAILTALGVRTVRADDVGVAGLHRLLRALPRLERRRPSVYLAFAGREGALPTVLSGLVRAPVVGVPTSIGYGRGGKGAAALDAMLQSCAPIAVVNIDAAVPAALFAVQLLAGAARSTPDGRPRRAPRSARRRDRSSF